MHLGRLDVMWSAVATVQMFPCIGTRFRLKTAIRPKYLDSLVINLTEYYRAAVATIVNKARAAEVGNRPSVAEISIEYGILRRYFCAQQNERTLAMGRSDEAD
jgi:hypothetical protein